MIGAVTAPIIFYEMHFLLISENKFFHEIKCDGMTGFMKFIKRTFRKSGEIFDG